jgi:hypothetical protein
MSSTDPRWRTRPPVIEMTAEGEFIDVGRPGGPPLSTKIVAIGILVAAVAGTLGIAMLALWLAMTLIPIALVGGLLAYAVVRLQLWQARRRSLGGKRDLFRP